MGKCSICNKEGCKVFLFKPSEEWLYLCRQHFNDYLEYSNNNTEPNVKDWLKKMQNKQAFLKKCHALLHEDKK